MPNLHRKTAWRPHHVILNLINLATKCIKDMAHSENLLDTQNDNQKFFDTFVVCVVMSIWIKYRFLNTWNLHPINIYAKRYECFFIVPDFSSLFSLFNTRGIFHLWTFAENHLLIVIYWFEEICCARYYKPQSYENEIWSSLIKVFREPQNKEATSLFYAFLFYASYCVWLVL